MVYLIVDTERKFCKIGFSKTPESRLKTLQRETVLKLELIFVIVGNMGTERYMHQRFSRLNASREWFKFDQSIYDYFEKCYNDAENVAYRNNLVASKILL